MKNTEKNKKKWVEKVRYTLELGGVKVTEHLVIINLILIDF